MSVWSLNVVPRRGLTAERREMSKPMCHVLLQEEEPKLPAPEGCHPLFVTGKLLSPKPSPPTITAHRGPTDAVASSAVTDICRQIDVRRHARRRMSIPVVSQTRTRPFLQARDMRCRAPQPVWLAAGSRLAITPARKQICKKNRQDAGRIQDQDAQGHHRG